VLLERNYVSRNDIRFVMRESTITDGERFRDSNFVIVKKKVRISRKEFENLRDALCDAHA